MFRTGDTSTAQMSQRELAVRFLTRTQVEITQMRACLPEEPIALEPPAVAQIERMAHKISGAAESFGFPQISAIAAAIELLAHDSRAKTCRERLLLLQEHDTSSAWQEEGLRQIAPFTAALK